MASSFETPHYTSSAWPLWKSPSQIAIGTGFNGKDTSKDSALVIIIGY